MLVKIKGRISVIKREKNKLIKKKQNKRKKIELTNINYEFKVYFLYRVEYKIP